MAEKFEFLAALPADQLQAVRTRLVRSTFDKDDEIFHAGMVGDSLYLVDRGKVRIEGTTPLGRTATFAIVAEGSYFGELSLIGDNRQRSATAIAIENNTSLLRLDQEAFHELRTTYPSVNDVILDVLAQLGRRLSEQLLETLFFDSDLRIVRRLLSLCETYGVTDDRSTIGLTQQAIADLSGVTRPTLNKLLKPQDDSLDAYGPAGGGELFTTSRGGLVVNSFTGLAALADQLMEEAKEEDVDRVLGAPADAARKIAECLLSRCELAGSDDDSAVVELSQAAFARLAGVTRTSLRIVLKEQAPADLLTASAQQVVIHSHQGLVAWHADLTSND